MAVNPGSDTVSLFTIDGASGGTTVNLVDQVSSGGAFPVSMAASVDGKQACVLNGGNDCVIQCYALGGGKLSPTGSASLGLNQTNPPSGCAGYSSLWKKRRDSTSLLIQSRWNGVTSSV